MPTNPPAANYATPIVTRAGTLISELNVITPRTLNKFFKKYNFMGYFWLSQMSKNGSLPLPPQMAQADNKLFYHWENAGRLLGYFTTTANSAGGVNTAITVTLTPGSHSASGTRSLAVVGNVFKNSRTNCEVRVSAANTTTVNAHTATLTPVNTAMNTASLATDEWLDYGFKYVGEGSDYTTTKVQPVGKYVNYCSQIRFDARLTDLAGAERMDFEVEGQNYYFYKQFRDDLQRGAAQKELMLLDSNLTDNLGYSESGTIGMIQNIQANGIANIPYNSFSVQGTLAALKRALDSEGGPKEYDWLMDSDQESEVQLAIFNQFPNGSIVYNQDDLRSNFKSIDLLGRKFNFAGWDALSERITYGSSGNGAHSNFGILVPRGTRDMKGDTNANDMSQLIIRYQKIFNEGGENASWYTGESGLYSKNGQNTNASLTQTHIGYFGLQMIGVNQFAIISQG